MTDSLQLDDVDRQILDRLKRNGRESAASIAKHANLSAAAVQRRIAGLEKRKVIKGYTVAVDSGRIEASIDGYIELSFHHSVDMDAEMDKLIRRPQVREAVTLTGQPDALLRVRVKTAGELGRLSMELRQLGLFIRVESHVVIARWWHGAIADGEKS